jgi:hypothetical protein
MWELGHKNVQVIVGQLYLLGKGQSIHTVGQCEHFCLVAIPLASNYVGQPNILGSSPSFTWWANASWLLRCYSTCNWHMLGLYASAYRLLWANSMSLERESPFALWAHTSIPLSSHPASFELCAHVMGHCQLIIEMMSHIVYALGPCSACMQESS